MNLGGPTKARVAAITVTVVLATLVLEGGSAMATSPARESVSATRAGYAVRVATPYTVGTTVAVPTLECGSGDGVADLRVSLNAGHRIGASSLHMTCLNGAPSYQIVMQYHGSRYRDPGTIEAGDVLDLWVTKNGGLVTAYRDHSRGGTTLGWRPPIAPFHGSFIGLYSRPGKPLANFGQALFTGNYFSMNPPHHRFDLVWRRRPAQSPDVDPCQQRRLLRRLAGALGNRPAQDHSEYV